MRKISTVFLVLGLAQVSFGQLSGPLSGTLGPGVYNVVGEISVESGDNLTLLPGTTFIFDGPYPFRIYGTLLAEGTSSDSIVFTTDTLTNPDRWPGIRFYSVSSSGSQLAYCLVENGSATGSFPDNSGGGVFCRDAASPTFTNCTFSANSATNGGGVYSYYSAPTFTNCSFTDNFATNGAGVYCNHSSSTFTNCTSSRNSSSSNGGGVYCYYSSLTVANCTIHGNSAAYGGGVYCNHSSSMFTSCTINGNSSTGGAGVYYYYSSSTFESTIVSFSNGSGLFFRESSGSGIVYCDIFGSTGGDMAFYGGNPTHGPAAIGERSLTNTNGDSADVYLNIFCDPMFADTANDDYHLTAASCCIDAGTPCGLDPDDTISDIGVYYFHHALPDYDESREIHLCHSLEETGRYLSWPPFGNATGYKVYRATQVDLPLNQWDLLETTSPDVWDYLDTDAFDAIARYFYCVVVVY